MKPTQIAELLANIKNTFVSFFSILMFVALAVGIFLGILWSGPALRNAANEFFDRGAFHDIQVQFSYGLTDSDIQKLSDVEGVTDIESGRQSFQEFTLGSEKYTAKVQTLGTKINVPVVVEGELPKKAGEIALLDTAAKNLGVGVGDELTFKPDRADEQGDDSEDDADGMKYLNASTFKVTALVNSPEYLAVSDETYGFSNTPSGLVHIVAFALPEAFDGSAFQDGYPIVNVRLGNLRGMSTFSDEYKNKAKDAKSRIVELGNELSLDRYDSLHGDFQSKLDDANKELADGKKKIEDGEADLNKARNELAQARSDLAEARADGNAKLADSRAQLESLESQRDAAAPQVAQLKASLDSAESQLGGIKSQADGLLAEEAAIYAQYGDDPVKLAEELATLYPSANVLASSVSSMAPGLPEVTDPATLHFVASTISEAFADYRNIPIPIGGQETTINALQAQYDNANGKLTQLNNAIDAGWSQYRSGEAQLNQKLAEGRQKISDGEKQISDGEAELEKARKEAADAEAKVADNQERVDQMKKYNWGVFTRAENASTVQASTFSNVTTNLSFSMAMLFVIVGLLVSYSAVSRIVHKQVIQIGTKKALGLRRREITLSFLAYSALAVVAGAIIGTIVGVTLVEGIIGHVLGSMFVLGDYPPYFGLMLFLIVTLLEIGLVLGVTWFACSRILKEHAVTLLSGEKPPEAKTRFYEKWAIWERLPLFSQTMVNNCMNDKRRVFSTVVGVAGCTALIVTAVTLNNDVLKSYDTHYDNVYSFNDVTYVDADNEGALDRVQKAIDDQGSTTAQAYVKGMSLTKPDGEGGTIRVVVPARYDDFAKVYHVNSVSGSPVDLSGEGVWVSQAYRDHYGAKVGDTIKIEDNEGVTHEMPILGFHEFWLTYSEMVMGRDYYEKEFGKKFEPNVVLSDRHGTTFEDISAAVSKVDGYYAISDDKAYRGENFAQFSNISSAVVAIYLSLAALMAIVVLLNLNVMFIDEKKRELIVLMINGFSVKDAKRYIYNDTIVLTAIGILLGLIIGCIGGSLTVYAVEPSSATLMKSIDPMAVAVGVVGSAVLAFIMSIIALRRIPRFELTDINKF